MKKGLILFIAITILLLLIIRAFFLHADGIKKEKLWYVKNLNFEFSASVDSLLVFSKNRGVLFFQITDGEVSNSTEDHTNRQLKHNGNLRFILKRPNNKLAIGTTELKKYLIGDSIRIITEQNVIKIYRNKIFIAEAEIAKSLSGRPF